MAFTLASTLSVVVVLQCLSEVAVPHVFLVVPSRNV